MINLMADIESGVEKYVGTKVTNNEVAGIQQY